MREQDRSAGDLTGLLQAWSAGDESALDRLTPLVYSRLRRLARSYMLGEKPGHPLQSSDLVQEAYLRLLDAREISWQDRAHFFAVSARVMRRILVDFARSQRRLKRSGNEQPIDAGSLSLDDASLVCDPSPTLVALDDALKCLSQIDERRAQIVELRYFGGLTAQETAAVLQVSEETVLRDWKLAKAWLSRELDSGKAVKRSGK